MDSTGHFARALGIAGILGAALTTQRAQGQDASPQPAAEVAAAADSSAPAPPAPAAPPAEQPAAPAPPPQPEIDVGVWLRAGARVQGSDNPKALNDVAMDTVFGELNASGKVHDQVTLTLNLAANGLAGSVGILDAIVAVDFAEPLHLWAGQFLVPVDRANFAGPFFMLPWNCPGLYTVGAAVVPATPHAGPYGRNAGAVLWGEAAEGKVHYYGGVFAPNVGDSPLYSARVSFAPIGAEHGYYASSTYSGAQNIVAIDVGLQYQKDGSAPPPGAGAPPGTTDNYTEINAGVFGEYKLTGASYLTGEAAYYHFAGDYEPVKDNFYLLAAYTTDRIGIGQIQPLLRYQMGSREGFTVSAIDVFVNYLIAGPALRLMFGFQHTDLDAGVVGNALQLGVQGMLF
jgi:hypothetical protein